MKLKYSWFNPTVLKKDITRFAPLWGLYGVCCLLSLLGISIDATPSELGHDIFYLVPLMALVNCAYACVCALCLFGDLFSTRRCYALHAMPMRREGWLLTHTVAGLLYSLVPNCLITGLACLWLEGYRYMAFIWLAVMALQFLFFFGLAVFSSLCAGNRLGMFAVYSLLNLAGVILGLLVDTYLMPVLPGFIMDWDLFTLLSPLWKLTTLSYGNYGTWRLLWEKGISGEAWLHLGIYAAVGLVLLGLSLLVYRKRKLEYAGDFLALKFLAPILLGLYTLGPTTVLFVFALLVSGLLGFVFLAIGLVVGFFTGKMLLERKVHVFKPKVFLQFGIFVTAFALVIGIAWLDPMGVTRYTPDTEDVETAYLYPGTRHIEPWQFYWAAEAELTEPADIEELTQLHKSLVRQRHSLSGVWEVTIVYRLKNGLTVSRYYSIPNTCDQWMALNALYDRASAE